MFGPAWNFANVKDRIPAFVLGGGHRIVFVAKDARARQVGHLIGRHALALDHVVATGDDARELALHLFAAGPVGLIQHQQQADFHTAFEIADQVTTGIGHHHVAFEQGAYAIHCGVLARALTDFRTGATSGLSHGF